MQRPIRHLVVSLALFAAAAAAGVGGWSLDASDAPSFAPQAEPTFGGTIAAAFPTYEAGFAAGAKRGG